MAKPGPTTNLHKGLVKRSPPPPDGKITKMSGSVNSETTRKETAPTPKTLGPREA